MVALLTACGTSPPRSQVPDPEILKLAQIMAGNQQMPQAQPYVDKSVDPIRAEAESQCSGYGFVRGTSAFAQCILQVDMARRSALEQREQLTQAREQRFRQCKFEEARNWVEPGNGDFFENAVRVRQRFESCMAGIPPPPKIEIVCNRIGRDDIRCSSR